VALAFVGPKSSDEISQSIVSEGLGPGRGPGYEEQPGGTQGTVGGRDVLSPSELPLLLRLAREPAAVRAELVQGRQPLQPSRGPEMAVGSTLSLHEDDPKKSVLGRSTCHHRGTSASTAIGPGQIAEGKSDRWDGAQE